MSSTTAGLSVADLERILDERKSQLQELGKRRDQLHKELEQLDDQIQSLVGIAGRGRRRRRRIKNEASLRDVVVEILSKNKKGFTLADLQAKVGEAGYRSASKNFRNVLYQCLYNTEGIVHDENTGCYRMEKA
jgi:chromosome segregation ATPase